MGAGVAPLFPAGRDPALQGPLTPNSDAHTCGDFKQPEQAGFQLREDGVLGASR